MLVAATGILAVLAATAFGAEGETIATCGKGVTTHGETNHHLRLWAVTAALKPGKYRLHVQHAVAGPRGALHLTAWTDIDNDGTPDRQLGMSPELTAKADGARSSWNFRTKRSDVFVGYTWKQEDEVTCYSGKRPKGYQGFGNAMFYGTSFLGKPEGNAERYSNLRLEFLGAAIAKKAPKTGPEKQQKDLAIPDQPLGSKWLVAKKIRIEEGRGFLLITGRVINRHFQTLRSADCAVKAYGKEGKLLAVSQFSVSNIRQGGAKPFTVRSSLVLSSVTKWTITCELPQWVVPAITTRGGFNVPR